jgi:hypothetical protein
VSAADQKRYEESRLLLSALDQSEVLLGSMSAGGEQEFCTVRSGQITQYNRQASGKDCVYTISPVYKIAGCLCESDCETR